MSRGKIFHSKRSAGLRGCPFPPCPLAARSLAEMQRQAPRSPLVNVGGERREAAGSGAAAAGRAVREALNASAEKQRRGCVVSRLRSIPLTTSGRSRGAQDQVSCRLACMRAIPLVLVACATLLLLASTRLAGTAGVSPSTQTAATRRHEASVLLPLPPPLPPPPPPPQPLLPSPPRRRPPPLPQPPSDFEDLYLLPGLELSVEVGDAALDDAAASSAASAVVAAPSDEAWCRRTKLERRVVPGQSWGGLSEADQAEWKTRRCDKFFCRPNAMESRGTYRCVPVGDG